MLDVWEDTLITRTGKNSMMGSLHSLSRLTGSPLSSASIRADIIVSATCIDQNLEKMSGRVNKGIMEVL
jgi:hypothetical protein